jgi:hypothetical protein
MSSSVGLILGSKRRSVSCVLGRFIFSNLNNYGPNKISFFFKDLSIVLMFWAEEG